MWDMVAKPDTFKDNVRLHLKIIIFMIYLNCLDSLYQRQLCQAKGNCSVCKKVFFIAAISLFYE